MENSQQFSKNEQKMYQKERIDKIMSLLKQNGYLTVKEIAKELCYSNATINRDLNIMEKQNLIKRSYGGVEILGVDENLKVRYQKMKTPKMRIAKKAAEFIKDGDTIFIDGSTTCEFIGQYLTDKKDLTVITNNMALVSFLSEYSINAVCLGGSVIEKPCMLMGDDTVLNARRYFADKMFFSTGGICMNGNILFGGKYALLHQTMIENSEKVFFLADHDKICKPPANIKRFDELDYVIVDFKIDDKAKQKAPNTKFIEI